MKDEDLKSTREIRDIRVFEEDIMEKRIFFSNIGITISVKLKKKGKHSENRR